MPEVKRAVIFANGTLSYPEAVHAALHPEDMLIAADGGARLCHQLGLTPAVLIGDFDSLDEQELAYFETRGSLIVRHPTRKDYTDLELALRHALSVGASDILIFAALGSRWDHTLANLLLPAAADLTHVRIRLADGPQEVMLLRGGSILEISGQPGDTVSLIPLSGDAQGITTRGLEYSLDNGSLAFGSTRGLSNVLLEQHATVSLRQGLLLCVVIHTEGRMR